MRIEYDPTADALYILLKPAARVNDTLDGGPGVNIDVDAKGNPVGIEVLYVVRRFGRDALTTLGVDLSGLQWSPVQDRLLSTGQAARILGVSRQYITRLVREGKIGATRAGRGWLIHQSALEKLRRGEHRVPARRLVAVR